MDKEVKAIGFYRRPVVKKLKEYQSLKWQQGNLVLPALNDNLDIVEWFIQDDSDYQVILDGALCEAHDYCIDNPDVKYLVMSTHSRLSSYPFKDPRARRDTKFWVESFRAHNVTIRFYDPYGGYIET